MPAKRGRGRPPVLLPLRHAAIAVMGSDLLSRQEIVERLDDIGVHTTVAQLDRAMNLRSDECGDHGFRHADKSIGYARTLANGDTVPVVKTVKAYAVVSPEAHRQIALERFGSLVANHLPQWRKALVDTQGAVRDGLGSTTDPDGIVQGVGVVGAMLGVQHGDLARMDAAAVEAAAEREAATERARQAAEIAKLEEHLRSE